MTATAAATRLTAADRCDRCGARAYVRVTLPGGAVLLLPTRPDHDDLAALRAAAQPLIDLLTTRGLLHDPRSSSRPF